MHKTKELPLVSAITPTYNRASLLEETILSVLNQDYARLEYIVLDDGSTDDTLDVIKKFEDKIRWETHENMGETQTVNKGFSMANGEIIGVVNSDDPLLPDAISTIVARMMAEPELLVVYPDYAEIDANGRTIQHIQKFDYSYINMLRWHLCIPGPGTFFRREVVDKLQGRDPQFDYVADFDFWLRAGLTGPFARIPYTLATFRVHPDSASIGQRGDLMAKEHIQLVNKIYSLPDLPPEVLRVKREAYSSAYYVAVSGNKSSITKKKYYLLALYHCPWKYLGEYRRRLLTIFAELLYYHPLKALFMRFFQPHELVSIVKRKLFKYQR